MQKIVINLKPSKQFITLIFTGIIGSLAIIFSLMLSLWIKLVIALFTLSYGFSVLIRHGLLLHARSILRLSSEDNSWLLEDELIALPAHLLGDSTATTWLCVLRFKLIDAKQYRSCVIFNDALSKQMYRRLLVYLRTYHFTAL
jgi:hypothetical protein